MDILTTLFSKILGNADKVIDEVVTSKEEKLILKNKLQEIVNEAEKKAGEEVSNRWMYDLQWGNKLSKSIRPLTLIFLTAVFTIISFADGNIGEFQLNKDLLPIWNTILLAVYSAYFVGRSVEKVKDKE